MEKLKPCPFCGEKDDITIAVKRVMGHPVAINGMKYYRVECLPCDAKTGDCFDGDADIYGLHSGRDVAIYKWNNRA